jgi:hypothetical protein
MSSGPCACAAADTDSAANINDAMLFFIFVLSPSFIYDVAKCE